MVAKQVADIITFPARTALPTAAGAMSSSLQLATAWTANDVDDWGRDNGFVNRIWALSRHRWHTSVGGSEHVPRRAGALIVVNARRFSMAPVFAALAIGAAVDRPVRFVGRPDVAPVGPLMQRLGGLLPDADELHGVLRAGQLVVLGAEHRPDNERSGQVDHHLVAAAIATGVRVLPAATLSTPMRRSARVEIGPAVRLARRRRGPLAELETADVAQARIDALLDEMGGTSTGTPLDWLPLSSWGGA
jgi:hypothetical protein